MNTLLPVRICAGIGAAAASSLTSCALNTTPHIPLARIIHKVTLTIFIETLRFTSIHAKRSTSGRVNAAACVPLLRCGSVSRRSLLRRFPVAASFSGCPDRGDDDRGDRQDVSHSAIPQQTHHLRVS